MRIKGFIEICLSNYSGDLISLEEHRKFRYFPVLREFGRNWQLSGHLLLSVKADECCKKKNRTKSQVIKLGKRPIDMAVDLQTREFIFRRWRPIVICKLAIFPFFFLPRMQMPDAKKRPLRDVIAVNDGTTRDLCRRFFAHRLRFRVLVSVVFYILFLDVLDHFFLANSVILQIIFRLDSRIFYPMRFYNWIITSKYMYHCSIHIEMKWNMNEAYCTLPSMVYFKKR